MDVKDFLIKLCEAPHVSGYEGAAAEIARAAFAEYLDEVTVDSLGNVIGVKKCAGEPQGRLMLAAHIDEIGMMVTGIDEKGFVLFTTIGGFDDRVFPAREVTIHGREEVFGVIGVKPPHLIAPGEADNAYKRDELKIDAGYGREKISELVGVGDIITVNAKTTELKNNLLSGKSMDDCVGAAVLYSAMRQLKDVDNRVEIYYVCTAQEEVGIRGAITAAYVIAPDIGIAVDVGFGKTPELDDAKTVEIGGGPAIAVGPGMHPGVSGLLKKTAADANLKYQIEVLASRTGTDADSMQISGTGVAAGVLSVPLKYMHTPVETVDMADVEMTGRLIAEFVRALGRAGLEDALCL